MADPARSDRGGPPRQANQRGASRLGAVQALYQMEIAGTAVADVVAEFELFRLGKEIDGDQYRSADVAWFRDVVVGVVERQREIDPAVDRVLVAGWPLGRVDATLRAILRAATYELIARRDVPARVVITEYVDIARAFFAEGDEPRLANGVLDRLAHDFRASEFEAD